MNDDDSNVRFVRQYLRTAIPPWPELHSAPDLWPQMRRRIQQAPPTFGWFESAIAAALAAAAVTFPKLMLLALFHL